jgi:hypothetical protein
MVIQENWMGWREVLVVSVECRGQLVAVPFLIVHYVMLSY